MKAKEKNTKKAACGWSTSREVPPQSVSDKLVTCPQEEADIFNAHFCRQWSTFPSALSFPFSSWPANVHKQPWLSILSGVFSGLLLWSLPAGKSAGPDNIFNELFAPAISAWVARCNFEWPSVTWHLSRSWKESSVSPVQKAGKDATKPVSYRPISLLINVSKAAEKLVHVQLIRHCMDNRIIPDEQLAI